MGTEFLPEYILTNYEVHEWKHACAILKYDFPNEWKDLLELLMNFRINKSWITAKGGSKSQISSSHAVITFNMSSMKLEGAVLLEIQQRICQSYCHGLKVEVEVGVLF